jgi:hypothetical protein
VIFGGVRMLNAIGLENSSGCLLGPVPYRFRRLDERTQTAPKTNSFFWQPDTLWSR